MPRARLVLAVVAVAVIALAIVLWRSRGRATTPSTDPVATTPTATGGGATPSGVGAPPIARGSSVTPTPDDPTAPVSVDERGTRTYVMDNGAVIRDHRGPDYGPPIVPPPMPPGKRTMSTEVTAKIYAQLKPAVTQCAAQVSAADRGADPFVYVTMTVAVTNGRLATTDVYPTLNDLKGPSVAAFTDCVRKQGLAVSIEQSGEPDRTDYVVQYPLRLR
ncbi:MAG: hypothetical protein IPL61_06215 [Myxococcales bacterium]|nr:hypothetical protein [Myxococcales bacterium]